MPRFGAPGHVPAEDVELLSDVSDFLAVVLVHLLQQVRRLHRQKLKYTLKVSVKFQSP
jgi:hypothetical protein